MACMRDGFESGRPLDNGRFTTVTPLNHGSFGMVLAAKDTLTGQDVAIKCITKPGAAASINCPAAIATDDRSEELDIHSRLALHPNIVNLIHHFETDNHQYMVLELCSNGDLYEAIRMGKGPLNTEHVREFMLELVNAVDYLHSNGVFHRDIKPENIFLTANGSMKLGDFGLATTETWSTEFAVGSDRYMAPEQYDASNYGYGYSPASADVWAIGIVLLNVLFQRNPFATPTLKDPLFADFVHDRQSLFDLFPNMSQDTYNVLAHSMTLDPANRSLAAVREAIKDVVSFTIDEEPLDDFCNEPTPLVPVSTAARQPLRTPSVTSPNTSSADSFPWNSALLKTPQKTTRQLSTIHDEEMDMFPESLPSSRKYGDADEASLSSNLDSGLGLSYKSTTSGLSIPPALPAKSNAGFIGSLPISFSRPTTKTTPYTANAFSKSWSDLWDEEEEMRENLGMDIDRLGTAKPSTPRPQFTQEDGRGSVTPRQGLVAIDVNVAGVLARPASRNETKVVDQPKTSLFDKWAALGNFRRAKVEPLSTPAAPATPAKTKYSEAFASFTSFRSSSSKKPTPQLVKTPAQPVKSWRQGSPQRLRATSTNKSQVWQEDKNWREHRSPAVTRVPSPPLMASKSARQSPSRVHHKRSFLDEQLNTDDDDFEWAAGAWKELHL